MTQKWYNFVPATADETILWIDKDIGDDGWSESLSARNFVADLSKVSTAKILLKINSYGGSVFDGIAIHNALRDHPAQVTGRVMGVAASIASVILMACDRIEMPANTMLMIHDPWIWLNMYEGANADEMRRLAHKMEQDAVMLDNIKQALVASYRRSGLADDRLAELMAEETWLTAEQAVTLGFADTLLDSISLDDVASAYKYKNKPKTLAELMKNKAVFNGPAPEPTPAPEPAPEPTPAPEPAPDPNLAAAQVEVARRAEVKAVCRELGLPDALTAPFLADTKYTGATLRAACLQQSPHAKPLHVAGSSPAPLWQHGEDAEDKFRAAIGGGILASARIELRNSDGTARRPAPGSEDYQNLTALELCKVMLSRRNVSYRGFNSRQIALAALDPTGDFPILLEKISNDILLSSYMTKPAKRQAITYSMPARNYKEIRAIRLEAEADLEEMLEDGKLPIKHLVEGEEKYRVKDRGMKIGVTRHVIVNDELNAVMAAISRIAQRIPKIEDKDVFGYLHGNPLLSDGYALFSAEHGNLATAGALSNATLSVGRNLLAAQLLLTGEECEAEDEILLTGINDRTAAEEITVGITLPNDARRPVFAYLQPVWSSKITGAFYQFANPLEYPIIGFSYLDGASAPYIEYQQDFGTRSIQMAIVHTYGYGAIGHVGAVKTPAT